MNGEQNTAKQRITQESLQPRRIPKEWKAYQSVLDIEERLRKGDATNIALTGPYGSGKSSILLSLKEDYPSYNYLNISLATLQPYAEDGKTQPTDEEDDDEVTKQNLDRLIEYSILQQLIYREKQETLPNSRLKRIFHLSEKRVCRISIATILAIVALIIIFEPTFLRVEWICDLFAHKWLNIVADTLSIAYLTWFVFRSLKIIVPALSNSRLNKLNLKSGEIEIVKNTSIFNKHLDEILYFFEKTSYNVVILEDLDRFNSTAIFLKLRELNLLLNESQVINRTIFFVYAVRDDMFKDEERVKCFDYITTVIPIINPSNAKNQLKEELEKRGVMEIKGSVLRDLGFFLRDMRLLKNIANEYVQYRGRLEDGISGEKLLAMIVYKNYFPQDFANLHDCKGTLYELLNLKDTFVEERMKAIEEENARKQEQKVTCQKERHLKEKELRRIYLDEYIDRLGGNVQQIKVGDSFYSPKDIAVNEKLFDRFVTNPNVEYMYVEGVNGYRPGRSQKNTANIPFAEVEKSVNPQITFSDRLAALQNTFEELEDVRLTDIKKEDIKVQSISQVMAGIDYAKQSKYAALDVPPLIEFLVVNGYIDENYYDYISYFYDNFVDNHDWAFVLDLKLGKTHPYDYPVHQVEACLLEIPHNVFRKNAILNIEIVDYLAETQNERLNAARLTMILKTIVDGRKYDFLIEYYEKGKHQDNVFETLFSLYHGLWPDFVKYDNKDKLKLIWYKYAELNLSCQDSREWLSAHYDFVTGHLLDISDELWCTFIREKEYCFKELDVISKDILKVVAEKNAYELNKNNVQTLVGCLLDMDCESVSYSLVNQTGHEQLINRIDDNLGECMASVFSSPESEKETEDAIVGILYSYNVGEDDIIAYLKRQQKKINLKAVESNQLKPLALKCNVVEPTWENVILYLHDVSEKKMDVTLKSFIETNAEPLAMDEVPSNEKEDERMLLRLLVASDELSFESYRILIDRFTKWYYTHGVPAVVEKRLGLMIEKGMIHFTEENTASIVGSYSDNMVVAYLMRNKRDYLSKPETVDYNTGIAEGVMKANLSQLEKALVIPCFTTEILTKDLANEVVSVLTTQEISLDVDFLLKVLSLSNKTDEKITVINYTLEKNRFDEQTVSLFIKTLPYPYGFMAEKGKKPELPNTDRVVKLVRILKDKNYISSYTIKDKGVRVNTKLR